VKRVTLSALEGINGTVFVYGQTGSGKTYTMLGKERMPQMKRRQSSMTPHSTFDNSRSSHAPENQGVLIFALHDLFREMDNDQYKSYFLKCSYVEIYNE